MAASTQSVKASSTVKCEEKTILGNSQAVAYMFRDTRRDSTTGLDLHKDAGDARRFDPGTASWVSRDPVGFAMGDANLCRAMGNALTDGIDPSGYEEITKEFIPDNNWSIDTIEGRTKELEEELKSSRDVTAAEYQVLQKIAQTQLPKDPTSPRRLALEAYIAAVNAVLHKKTVEQFSKMALASSRAPAGNRPKIDASIADLGHKDFQTRDAASKKLPDMALRDPFYAYPALGAALASKNPELQRRALAVLQALVNSYVLPPEVANGIIGGIRAGTAIGPLVPGG